MRFRISKHLPHRLTEFVSKTYCIAKLFKKNVQDKSWTFFLVDSHRENWNCIFADLITLNERLEQLGINEVSHDSVELKSYSLKNPQTNSTTNYLLAQENIRGSHV